MRKRNRVIFPTLSLGGGGGGGGGVAGWVGAFGLGLNFPSVLFKIVVRHILCSFD